MEKKPVFTKYKTLSIHFFLVVALTAATMLTVVGNSVAADKDRESLDHYEKIVLNAHQDWHDRIKAIRALGRSGNPEASDTLMSALYDPCPAIKWNAARALGNFRDDPRVVDALISALGDDTLYIREAAVSSLGRIDSVKAVPHLISLLQSKSFAIRIAVVKALGRIGNAEAIPYLETAARHDRDPVIRKEAKSALEKTRGTVKRRRISAVSGQ